VISGDEEARLSFAGATRGLPDPTDRDAGSPALDPPYLVVDIGGGSTEFVLGAAQMTAGVSIDIGCVRLTERHLHSDPPTAGEVEAATADIRAGITRAAETVPLAQARTLLGLAGSVTTVAALALGLPEYDADRVHHARISYGDVDRVTSLLLRAPRHERARLPMMHPGRVDVIGAGALILRTVMAQTHQRSVVPSEHDILDGIAYSLAEVEGQDPWATR
jgi:exopolyphosphatase/guanosine-5'-triphosphate,3'-diphosphate pyrophosphatase